MVIIFNEKTMKIKKVEKCFHPNMALLIKAEEFNLIQLKFKVSKQI